MDGGPRRRVARGPARRPHPHLERDRGLRGLRAAHGPRGRAPRHPEPGDALGPVGELPPARAARGARAAGRDLPLHATRPTRARSGKRTSSGSSSPGASTPTGRSGSAASSSRPTGRARSSTVHEYYRWIFENSVPGLPAAAASEGLTAARLHAALWRLPDRGGGARAAREDRGGAGGRHDRPRDGRRPRRAASHRSGDRREGRGGLPDALAEAGDLLEHARGVGLGRSRPFPATCAATSHRAHWTPGRARWCSCPPSAFPR